jgi:putative redox protein
MSEDWTEITAAWKTEMVFVGQDTNGAFLQMGSLDGKPGFSPMHLLLIAVAGCTGSDIVSILQKKHLALNDLQVRVRGKRAKDYPMIWTDIHLAYLVWGEAIQPRDVEQAIQLSIDKYCSVGLMLGKSARVTSEFQILKPGESAG